MTSMHRGAGWKIEVFGREHGTPHFHLRWPEGRASIGIESLEVLVGKPSARLLDDARRWARENQSLLLREWRRLNPR
jgi:hypothetical protein